MLKFVTAIDDSEKYAEIMKNKIEPLLGELGKQGYFTAEDGTKLHFVKYIRKGAEANVVISHGFTESGEKFREMAYYFLEAGCNVFIADHRGHGYSQREVKDVNTVHVKRFDSYVEDLRTFLDKIVKPHANGKPVYLYAHSMGGAVGILMLKKYPEYFDKAVLTAPMVSAETGPIPHPAAKILSGVCKAIGLGKKRVIGTGKFNPQRTYENSNDTSKTRFDYYQSKRVADKHYQTSSPSFSWVWEALRIIKPMTDIKSCEQIKTPILLFRAEQDKSVERPSQKLFADRTPAVEFVEVPESKHEIYMSTNGVLNEYLKNIIDFLNK